MEAKDTRVSKLAEMDRRYVWHPMARLSQPGAPMMVAAGEGLDHGHGGQPLPGWDGGTLVHQRRLRPRGTGQGCIRAAPEAAQLSAHLEPRAGCAARRELGEWLDDEYVFFFSNSGSEANEVAFKMTRQYHLQRGEGVGTSS